MPFFLRTAEQNNVMFRWLEADMDYFLHTREKVKAIERHEKVSRKIAQKYVDEELVREGVRNSS